MKHPKVDGLLALALSVASCLGSESVPDESLDVGHTTDAEPYLDSDAALESETGTPTEVTQDTAETSENDVVPDEVRPAMSPLNCDGWRNVGPTADRFWNGAIWATSASNMWAVGGDNLMHWDGATLTASPIGCDVLPTDLWGSESELWVTTLNGAVWHRGVDGVWNRHVVAEGVRLSAIAGTGPNAVWAVGDGIVAHWDGQGWTSERIHSGAGESPWLEGIWADSDGVWIVGTYRRPPFDRGPGVVYTRTSIGWQLVHETQSNLHAIWRTNDGVILVAGRTDTDSAAPESNVQRFDGNSWTDFRSPRVDEIFGIAANSEDDVWVFGQLNTVRHFDGVGWSEIAGPNQGQGFGAQSLWPIGGQRAWAWAGAAPMLLTATEAQSVRVGCCHINAAAGTGPDDVWLVGERGFVMHWDGRRFTFDEHIARQQTGGAQWPIPRLSAVLVTPSGTTWTVGSEGQVWRRRVDSEWQAMEAPTTALLTAVWGTSDERMWVVGLEGDEEFGEATGVLLEWDGQTWHEPMTRSLPGLRAVTGSGDDDVWAVGRGDELFRFDGKTWETVALGARLNLNDVVSRGPGRITAAGTYDEFSSSYAGLIIDVDQHEISRMRTDANEPILSLWIAGDMGVAFDSVPKAWMLVDGAWVSGPRLDDFATSPRSRIWSDGGRLWVSARDGYVYLSPPLAEVYQSLQGTAR